MWTPYPKNVLFGKISYDKVIEELMTILVL